MLIKCPNCNEEIEITNISYTPETRWEPEDFDFEYVHLNHTNGIICRGPLPHQEEHFNLTVYHAWFRLPENMDVDGADILPSDDDLPF